MGFKERFDEPSSTLTYGYYNKRIGRAQHNHKILKWVIKKMNYEENNTSPLGDTVKTLLPKRRISSEKN